MHLLPHDNWQNEIKDFNMSNLNFTWNVTSFRKNVLKVQLNFNSPINISPQLEQDRLFINITNAMYEGHFKSLDGRQLSKDKLVFIQKVRPQMPNDEFNRNYKKSIKAAGSTGMATLLIVLLINLFLNGVLQQMLQWLKAIQIVIHLPMLRILVPPNVSGLLEMVLPIITFDILEVSWTSGLLLEFDDPK